MDDLPPELLRNIFIQCIDKKRPITTNVNLTNISLVSRRFKDIIDDMKHFLPIRKTFKDSFLEACDAYMQSEYRCPSKLTEKQINDIINYISGQIDKSWIVSTNFTDINIGCYDVIVYELTVRVNCLIDGVEYVRWISWTDGFDVRMIKPIDKIFDNPWIYGYVISKPWTV